MSKKKLIDAEMLEQELSYMSSVACTEYFSSCYLYLPAVNTGNPDIDFAVNIAIERSMEQQQKNTEMLISTILQRLSSVVRECTYQDHPCLLCRDDNDPDPIEILGDKIYNK